MKQQEQHLAHQQSCRRLYGAWREESKRNPSDILCIIHDKMDTAKTALPRMRVTTKATQGLGQLPMNVTGMVSHGHGDGAYAHYSPHCWPGDSNATISLLARLFRPLEGPSVRESGALLQYPPQNSLFEALLRGKSRCLDLLPHTDGIDMEGRKPLPRKLYLQLDNSAKDNKNKYLMAFLFLLTARGVFEEIQAGFLLVDHTHEDIDAYFSHLLKALKSKNMFVLADLMKAFMQSQDLSSCRSSFKRLRTSSLSFMAIKVVVQCILLGLERCTSSSSMWTMTIGRLCGIRNQPLMRNGNPSIDPPFDCGLQTGTATQKFLRAHQSRFHSSLCGEVKFQILLGIK